MESEKVILSTLEVSETARELHTRFAHWREKWDEMDKEAKRPYIRAASLMLTAKTISERTHG